MRRYLITDPKYHSDTPEQFEALLRHQVDRHAPDLILYRDKQNRHYPTMAKLFLEICSEYELKSILHGDVSLAIHLNAYGVHLTSQQFAQIAAAKGHGLHVIVSTHSEKEIREVIALGADAVTYSPIFATPNKGEPKGLEDLKEIVGKIPTNIFALGGITTAEQVKQVEATNVYGFASIRYFIED